MYGEGMGSLNVYTQPWNNFPSANLLWSIGGNQGPVWRSARVSLPPSSQNFQVSKERNMAENAQTHIVNNSVHHAAKDFAVTLYLNWFQYNASRSVLDASCFDQFPQKLFFYF